MKMFAPLFFCALLLPAFAFSKKKDILMGSVVKSKIWKMDRKKGKEIFIGDVSFINDTYTLKSDYAEYWRKEKRWKLSGNVYCMRRFNDLSKLTLFASNAQFNQQFENGVLWGEKKKTKAVYHSKEGRKIFSYSDRIEADYPKNRINFFGNFSLKSEMNYAVSDNASYDKNTEVFTMTGSRPIVRSAEQKYNFALKGNVVKYYQVSGNIAVLGNAYGWLDLKGAKIHDIKIRTTGKKLP